MDVKRGSELVIAPVCEAALLAVVGCAGWISHQPMIFTSLGPTAYELVETPHRRSARPYCVIAGHLIGVASGYLSLLLTGAFRAPQVSSSGVVPQRVAAACVAAAFAVFLTLLLRASQPAALSTTLLIALGSMQKPKDAVVIMAAVLLMTLIGEPLRALRLRANPESDQFRRGAAK
jgi:HPP family